MRVSSKTISSSPHLNIALVRTERHALRNASWSALGGLNFSKVSLSFGRKVNIATPTPSWVSCLAGFYPGQAGERSISSRVPWAIARSIFVSNLRCHPYTFSLPGRSDEIHSLSPGDRPGDVAQAVKQAMRESHHDLIRRLKAAEWEGLSAGGYPPTKYAVRAPLRV
jgi:hypothetical protein